MEGGAKQRKYGMSYRLQKARISEKGKKFVVIARKEATNQNMINGQ